MVSLSLTRDNHKVGGGRLGIVSSTPATAPTPALRAESRSPSEVQEIPIEEATRRSASRATNGKGPTGPTEETPTPRPKSRSMRELCSVHPGVDDRDYHAIRMSNLPDHAPDAPLEQNLMPLTYREGIWLDGEALVKYIRATQIPKLASNLYTLSSELLMDEAAKAMVLIETELLELTRSKDALRADLPRQAIEDYKKSSGFEMSLARMGRVSLEYGYQLAPVRLLA
ncbi:hypothetical protein B296_00039157 [Ensete ventricosum]|uniref:Uncharacterized protein n=1 Tax=Ensete ventricosum TaxID=4639 RepID=A0A426Y3E0_ENSVE|nr:hypothetical protein B296_00039157 [Ensete ventricosum]